MVKYFGKGEAHGGRAFCQITDINPAARLIHREDDRVMRSDWVGAWMAVQRPIGDVWR